MTECCLDVGDGINRYIKQLFYLLHSILQQIVFCAFAGKQSTNGQSISWTTTEIVFYGSHTPTFTIRAMPKKFCKIH